MKQRSVALNVLLPSLAVAGVGALGVLRSRFQHSQVFVPDRFPNGIWNPGPFGVPAQDVWFKAEDGVSLHGWWVPHRRARGTVLYCHGNTGSLAHQIGTFQLLRKLRVNVLGFDYRGYGRSEGQPSEKGLYRDVRAAYEFLTSEFGQPTEQIILFGHSLGGAIATDAAVDCPVAGLVVQSSFTHLKDAARAAFPALPVHMLARRRFHSLAKVARLEMPKLFIHGDADGTLPVSHGERLFERAAEPKQLYVVPNAGHNDVQRHGGLRYLWTLSRFRSTCLAGA